MPPDKRRWFMAGFMDRFWGSSNLGTVGLSGSTNSSGTPSRGWLVRIATTWDTHATYSKTSCIKWSSTMLYKSPRDNSTRLCPEHVMIGLRLLSKAAALTLCPVCCSKAADVKYQSLSISRDSRRNVQDSRAPKSRTLWDSILKLYWIFHSYLIWPTIIDNHQQW